MNFENIMLSENKTLYDSIYVKCLEVVKNTHKEMIEKSGGDRETGRQGEGEGERKKLISGH